MSENDLIREIQQSMELMQKEMQSTYVNLEKEEVTGEAEGILITISCTYKFIDIDIQPKAMQGGLKEFKYRIREAWKKACDGVQKTTQSKTMELLQGMQIPEEIRKMSVDQTKEEDDRGTAEG